MKDILTPIRPPQSPAASAPGHAPPGRASRGKPRLLIGTLAVLSVWLGAGQAAAQSSLPVYVVVQNGATAAQAQALAGRLGLSPSQQFSF